MRPSRHMIRNYGDEARLLSSRASIVALVCIVALYWVLPIAMAGSSFWLTALNFAGIGAIGAIGLTLLIGYSGQLSLGHAFFLGVGAYSEAFFGADLGLPLVLWLPAAALVGAATGALLGPFALRLRGNYLVIVTLGAVFIGIHVFRNWASLTGGLSGRATSAPMSIGVFDFARPAAFGLNLNRDQGIFWLIWLVVALGYVIAKNITRSRPGRALQAVRDRDIAAALVGISTTRYKISAFALSSAYGAVAGALYAAYIQYISPQEWDIGLSIQYIAMIVMGGMTAIEGAVLGALFVTLLPQLLEQVSPLLPFMAQSGSGGGLTTFVLNQISFGLLIVLFLLLEPRGLWAIWQRLVRYVKAWPLAP